MLTATERTAEGLALVSEAMTHQRLQKMRKRMKGWVELLGWFLRYAHGDAGLRGRALEEMRAGLTAPAHLGTFVDLGRNAAAAAAAGHPAPDLVAGLAKALQPEAGKAAEAFEALGRCPEWRG